MTPQALASIRRQRRRGPAGPLTAPATASPAAADADRTAVTPPVVAMAPALVPTTACSASWVSLRVAALKHHPATAAATTASRTVGRAAGKAEGAWMLPAALLPN